MRQIDKGKALSTGLSLCIIAILVGAMVYQHTPTEEPATALNTENESMAELLPEIPELAPVFEVIEEAQAEELPVVAEPVWIPSFAEAFADARNLLGPGQTFFWNGNEYSTNKAEDLREESTETDEESSEVNFAAEDSSGEILTHVQTP